MANAAIHTVLSRPGMTAATLGVAIASILFGLVPYFARELTAAGLAPHAIAFYRYALPALVLLPFVLRSRATRAQIGWALGGGAAMGFGWIGYAAAIETVPLATLSVLYMTYPAFTVLLSWALFSERPTRRAVTAAGLILIAAMLVVGPTGDDAPLAMMIWALGAPLGFAIGISVLVYRLHDTPPLFRLGATALGSVIGILPLFAATPLPALLPPDATAMLLIAGIALASAFVPQLIYVICSPVIGASRSAILGSLELPTMIAIAVFAYGDVLTLPQALGCALVLGAIWLTRSKVTRNVATNTARG